MTSNRGRHSLAADGRIAGEPGCDEAFDSIYRAFFFRLVRRMVCRFGLAEEDAFEVVQDAFVVALAKLDTEGQPGPWLYKTADHLAMNFRRKAGRRASLLARWGFAETEQEAAESEGGQP